MKADRNNNSLIFEKYQAEDFECYYAMVREDNVMRYITGKGLSVEEAREKFDSMLVINGQEEHLGFFKVVDTEGVFLGDGKLERYPRDPSLLEVGYILCESYWGRGYATYICHKMLALADTIAPHASIVAIIDPDNAASKRLLEKFGFHSFFMGMEDDLPTEKLLLKK